jgi:hypothetical protein
MVLNRVAARLEWVIHHGHSAQVFDRMNQYAVMQLQRCLWRKSGSRQALWARRTPGKFCEHATACIGCPTWAAWKSAGVEAMRVNGSRKADAGKPPVRFDEGWIETVIGLCTTIPQSFVGRANFPECARPRAQPHGPFQNQWRFPARRSIGRPCARGRAHSVRLRLRRAGSLQPIRSASLLILASTCIGLLERSTNPAPASVRLRFESRIYLVDCVSTTYGIYNGSSLFSVE